MSQDDFDYDINDIDTEEEIQVERLGTQHAQQTKAANKAAQQAKSAAAKQQKAVEKAAQAQAAAEQKAAQQAQAQQQSQSQQLRIDDMFKQSMQQRSQQQQQQQATAVLDIDALLRNATGAGDDGNNNNSDLLASLLAGGNGDDEDDDENGGFDINAILGLTSATDAANNSAAVKVEIPQEDDQHQQQQQHGHKQRHNLYTLAQQQQQQQQVQVKVELDSAASPQNKNNNKSKVLGDASTTTVTGSSKAGQNFTVAAAPEMKFAEIKHEHFDVKMEVKLEEGVATIQQSQSDAASENVSGDQKRLPPAISAEERRRKIPTAEELNNAEDITLRNVYWFDAKEASSNDAQDLAGTVLLFGRIAVRDSGNAATATYKSVCLRIPMKRYALFLPKQHLIEPNGEIPVAVKTAAILEARALCTRRGITNGAFKWVKRRYAFEENDVPTEESEWLKLKYPASHAPLWNANDNTPKFDNFQAVFGIHRSLMELLFINKRFEGPGFLDITHASAVPPAKRRSICQYEFVATSEDDVFVLTGTNIGGIPLPPQLTAASLHLRTQLDTSGHKHEIFAATIATCAFDTESSSAQPPSCRPFIGIRQWTKNDPFDIQLLTKGAENGLHIQHFSEEKDLIQWILKTLKDQDPDIIIGHNIIGFSLGILFSRIDELGIPRVMPDWCSLGRMQWKQVPRQLGAQKGGAAGAGGNHAGNAGSGTGFWEKEVCAGRLLVDTYTLSREYHKTSNYKLLSLAAELQLSGVFGPVMESHVEQPVELLNQVKMKQVDDLIKILGSDYNFALLCVRLTHKLGLIPLTKQLTTVAGTVWSRVLNGARSERIEYLLMHAFHQLKFVTPDKSGYKQRLALQTQAAQLEADKQRAIEEAKARAVAAAAAAAAEGEENTSEKVVTKTKKSTGATTTRRQRPTGASAISAADVFDNGGLGEGDDEDDIAVDGEGVALDDEDDLIDVLAGEDEAAAGGVSSNGPSATSKKTAKYKGGRVLEPEVGLYRDYVLLLDFNSLYPSLIQEFNVCFTTVERSKGAAALHDRSEPKIPSRDALICEACIKLPNAQDLYPCKHRCILPKVIRQLVEKRKNVRKQMKFERNPSVLNQLEIKQKAYKLTANSMYGCLGFEHSRFYAQKLAELVTLQGRTALGKTVEIVNTTPNQARVVYGDTDSVMIATGEFEDLDKVKALAEIIRKQVNKRYTHLELGMDGVFRSLLLHKKKKYAALTVVDWQGAGRELKQEVKGLEMVRRDWCKLAKQACDTVLKTALDPKLTDAEEVVETIGTALEKLADRVLNGQEPLNSYVIAKSIQRAPKDYKDAGSQPHVQVALRMQARKLPVFAGDLIPYVICDPPKPPAATATATASGTTTASSEDAAAASPDNQQKEKEKEKKPTPTQQIKQLAQRAYHEDEVKEQSLKIDAEWYLANQIYPPVLRLCEHIQGFTPEFLVSKLKITKSAVGLHEERNKANKENNGGAQGGRPAFAVTFKGMTLEEAYPDVVPLSIKCRRCGESHKQIPHTLATQILNKNHIRYQREFPRQDLAEKNKVIKMRWFNQSGILERVPWFYCTNSTCPDPFFAPSIVENSISMYLDNAVRQFYAAPNARSDAKYKKLLDQVSYIQRLIEVPASLIDPLERSLWSRAARFVDSSGKWRNAEEVAAAQRNAHKTYAGDEEMIKRRDETLKSKLVGKEALDRFLPLLPALKIDFGAEFFAM